MTALPLMVTDARCESLKPKGSPVGLGWAALGAPGDLRRKGKCSSSKRGLAEGPQEPVDRPQHAAGSLSL